MPLFITLVQVSIAWGSLFCGRIVDPMGSSVQLSLATALPSRQAGMIRVQNRVYCWSLTGNESATALNATSMLFNG